jgi:hypothetical protein
MHDLREVGDGYRLYRGLSEIVIQYHQTHAQFRVTWIAAHEGSLEKQIGAECLEPGKQVWGAQFPQQADEYEEKE